MLDELRRTRENRTFLPGFPLPRTVDFTSDVREAAAADMIFIAVPSQYFRAVFRELAGGGLSPGQVMISLTKGIEKGSGKKLSWNTLDLSAVEDLKEQVLRIKAWDRVDVKSPLFNLSADLPRGVSLN